MTALDSFRKVPSVIDEEKSLCQCSRKRTLDQSPDTSVKQSQGWKFTSEFYSKNHVVS